MNKKKLSLQTVDDEVAEILANLHTELYIHGKIYKQRKDGFNDLKGAIKLYEASNKTLESLKNAFEDASDRFLLGSVNSFDFIQSKQRYESAVSENIRSKFDYIFKLKVLEFYFGLPLSIPQSN